MLKFAVGKEFDINMAWSAGLLGHSLQHLVGFLNEIHMKSVHLHQHQPGADTTTAAGKAQFQMKGIISGVCTGDDSGATQSEPVAY